MDFKAYEQIKHWSLRSQLMEIQDRAESGRILAQAVRDGHTNDAQRDLKQLTAKLAELADWIGHVQRQHAPDAPSASNSPSCSRPGNSLTRGAE